MEVDGGIEVIYQLAMKDWHGKERFNAAPAGRYAVP
jgi:hypothetical protein